MRPERRGPRRPFHGKYEPEEQAVLAFEPIDDAAVSAVAQVERTLDDAGRRARAERGAAERPDPAFAAALRDRLVSQLPARAATHPIAGTDARPVPGWVVEPTAAAAARRTRVTAPVVPSDLAAGFVGFVPTEPMPGAGRPQRVVGRLAWTGPRLAVSPRWAAALVAAVLVVAAIGFGPGRTIFSAPAPSRATDVVGATLLRGGGQVALVDGTALQPGDEVRTALDGHATLVLGGSRARLDGGADVIVRTVNDDRIALDQQAGRVYHRVSVPSGGAYTVSTAGVTWTAHGTAFDLDREAGPSGTTTLTGLAVQHVLVVDGPGISATIAEGRRAEIVLAGSATTADLTTGAPTFGQLHDPWLAANAGLDAAAGFDPGILVALLATEPPATTEPTALHEPTQAEPTTEPPVEPSLDPGTPPGPTSAPPTSTPAPTDKPQPTPKETPKPTPTPKPIASLGLVARACPGGTVLDWTAAPADAFHHYKTYWSASSSFSEPAIVDGSSTTNRSATSTVDSAASGARWYRTYAYDAAGHVVAKSPTRAATGQDGPSDLGTLTVGPDGPNTSFSWPGLSVPDGCYSATKLVYASDGTPSYGEPGTTLLWWTGAASTTSVSTELAPPGTWWFRVQVLVETSLRTVVVSQTSPVQYTVP
jgi:hypothetical protein